MAKLNSLEDLKKRQQQLKTKVKQLLEVLIGSVVGYQMKCGKKNCKCVQGERFELDHRLEAYKRGNKLIINCLAPSRVELDVTDVSSLEAEIVRLCGLKTLSGQKYVTQQPIGQLFGVSRQMINRRKQLVQRHGLLTLLKGDYATEVLRTEVKQRIMELVVSNWYRSDEQIANTLIEEAHPQIAQTIHELSAENTVGHLTEGNYRFDLVVRNPLISIDQISNALIKNDNKQMIRIRDVASVVRSVQDATNLGRINGNPAIRINIIREPGTNPSRSLIGYFKKSNNYQKNFPQR